jgi:large subunit ribosomal protein L21
VYAIIEEGSGQFKVQPGDVILIDRLGLEQGSDIQFDRVLFVDGQIGTPYVDGASVKGKIKGPALGDKIYVQKFKRRKKYRRRVGHRQSYTEVEITSIDV